MNLDARDLVRSLRSTVCPACGGAKSSGMTLCQSDYYRLPAHARKRLYRRVGEGYESAFHAAMAELGVAAPILPAAPPSAEKNG